MNYSKKMPDINDLMDVWPSEIEEMFKRIRMPGPDIDLDLHTYATLACNLMDIPVHQLPSNRGLTESLHLLFDLYSDFKENQHFKPGMGYDQGYE